VGHKDPNSVGFVGLFAKACTAVAVAAETAAMATFRTQLALPRALTHAERLSLTAAW